MDFDGIEYLNRVLKDKDYTDKLKIYTQTYLDIEKTIPFIVKIRVMKKIAKLLDLQKQLVLREVEIRFIEGKERGENHGIQQH